MTLLATLVSSLIQNIAYAQRISSVSKSCFHNIRDLRSIFAIRLVALLHNCHFSLHHSEVDSTSTLNLSATKINHLQFALNYNCPELQNVTPIHNSLGRISLVGPTDSAQPFHVIHCHFVSPHLHLIYPCTFQMVLFSKVFKNMLSIIRLLDQTLWALYIISIQMLLRNWMPKDVLTETTMFCYCREIKSRC